MKLCAKQEPELTVADLAPGDVFRFVSSNRNRAHMMMDDGYVALTGPNYGGRYNVNMPGASVIRFPDARLCLEGCDCDCGCGCSR